MRTDHIKHRNMAVQFVLAIVTLGISAIYWYYVTLKELHIANNTRSSAGLWTVLAVVPVAQLWAYWHYACENADFVIQKYPAILIFVAWIIFFPVAWFLVQSELNKAATRQVAPRPTYST